MPGSGLTWATPADPPASVRAVAGRIGSGVAEGIATRVAERIAPRVAERIATGIAERIAARIAEPVGVDRRAADPNYEGACVPDDGADYDCADIGAEVTVVGSDPDGLDRDGDGLGCESYG